LNQPTTCLQSASSEGGIENKRGIGYI